jgi:hypothetical protein
LVLVSQEARSRYGSSKSIVKEDKRSMLFFLTKADVQVDALQVNPPPEMRNGTLILERSH